MKRSPTQHGQRALVLELDLLVAERARKLLEGDAYGVCVVGDPALFQEISRALQFDLYVVGLREVSELEALRLGQRHQPLVLLARVEGLRARTRLRLAAPRARLVDRRLRDPDGFRAALASARASGAEEAAPEPTSDAVRSAFEPFELSERQLEVVSRALLGEGSGEIGRRLFISEATVRNHLHAIYQRIGVSGRRELLGRFLRGVLEAAPGWPGAVTGA